MNDEQEKFEFGDHLASRLQLRELVENIKRGDIDYCSDMCELFKNQKLERLREENEAEREAIERQRLIDEERIYRSE